MVELTSEPERETDNKSDCVVATRQEYVADDGTGDSESTEQPLLNVRTEDHQDEEEEKRLTDGDSLVIIECRSRTVSESKNGTAKYASNENGLSLDDGVSVMTTKAVYKNLIIYSVAFMLIFSALSSFANIQSTINLKEGLGTTSIAILYAIMVFTNLCLTLFTLPLLSYKWMTVASMLTYSVFYATGFYSTWATLIPASIIVGFGASHLWPTQQAYISQLAVIYSRNTSVTREKTLTLFFGIFMGLFQSSQIWGNLSSSLIFGSSSSPKQENTTDSEAALSVCGPYFCPFEADRNNTIVPPPMQATYMFTAFCVAMSLVAVLLVATLVTNVSASASTSIKDKPKHGTKQCCTTISGVLRHMMTSRDQQLLAPVTILSGMTMAFVSGDFTVGYVSCPYGVDNIGFVMIAYGVISSVGAFLAGKLGACIGSLPVLFIGMVCEISALLTLLLWIPGVGQIAIVFILVSICGIADGLFQPVIMSLYSEYFMDGDHLDASLSSFRVINSIGWAASFGYSSRLCMRAKIIILLSMTILSGICLVILHFRHKTDKNSKYPINQPKFPDGNKTDDLVSR